MEYDEDEIDRAALALLYLGRHQRDEGVTRTWKGLDWSITERLHEKGYISDPKTKVNSIVFTEEGLEEAEKLAEQLFAEKPSND